MPYRPKQILKLALGHLPYTAELYQQFLVAGQSPDSGYAIEQLTKQLPSWLKTVEQFEPSVGRNDRKRIFVFGYLRWWLEYAVALALLLDRLGHEITLAYLPYRRWAEPMHSFDQRRQSAYLAQSLKPLSHRLNLIDLMNTHLAQTQPGIESEAEKQALIDVQYTLQREDLDLKGNGELLELYQLRYKRNLRAARAFQQIMEDKPWDTILLPNGSILEFGVIYRIARKLGTRTVTYEFGEQRERIWIAVDDEVMRQDTSSLWQKDGESALTDSELEEVSELYRARMTGQTWENFSRKWQTGVSKGKEAIREELALEPERTTVLLCTNVVGDSLALNRQIFTSGMSDWLAMTIDTLARSSNVDLIIRVHPGELLGAGHPSLEIVSETLPHVPAHVRLIPPESPINTYDLIQVADLGLVYTTTVGLEMAMRGLPVLVAGNTHYRGKGFTLDPSTREDYLEQLERVLAQPKAFRLSQDQIDKAWHYAYLFFFKYPKRFPWHLIDFWEDIRLRPMEKVFPINDVKKYESACELLTGTTMEVQDN